jgi:hypothetical protein
MGQQTLRRPNHLEAAELVVVDVGGEAKLDRPIGTIRGRVGMLAGVGVVVGLPILVVLSPYGDICTEPAFTIARKVRMKSTPSTG